MMGYLWGIFRSHGILYDDGMKKRKSESIEAVHETAKGLHKAGAIDRRTLRGILRGMSTDNVREKEDRCIGDVGDDLADTPQQARGKRTEISNGSSPQG